MQFPLLQSAVLIRRYKRFMADVTQPDGDMLTIHCANTGTMTGYGEQGDIIWYSDSKSNTRKYPCSWELTQLKNDQLVCINTHRSNQLTLEALQNKVIKEFAGLLCGSEIRHFAETQYRYVPRCRNHSRAKTFA